MVVKYLFWWCLVFLLFANRYELNAQTEKIYFGNVADSGQQLASANVVVINIDGDILGFSITDDKGTFQVKLAGKDAQQPLWIEASYIGYFKQRLSIDSNKQLYTFSLQRDRSFLQEVKITNRPKLEQMGDTLRYIVSSFAKNEDRSIGDVLRRMPGIKVLDDGTIYHNDKKIENLYIHGDDLMSGKYGAATKAVRKEMIRSVDIIQNHQPVKVLQNKVFSDKTSVNLVLKDENSIKVVSQADVGIGLPKLYDISANAILLNKKVKAINVVSLNNAGVDYSNQLKLQGSGNMAENVDKEIPEIRLSTSAAQRPDIAQNYYNNNNSRILNFNNLYNLHKGFQLKANMQIFNDRNKFLYQGITRNFTGGDTIIYNESQNLESKPKSFNGVLHLFANKNSYYFNNTFQYHSWREKNFAAIAFKGDAFAQVLKNDTYRFSNDLHWIPALKSKLILELRWIFQTKNYEKQLTLYDGYTSSIQGHEGAHDSVIQNIKDPVTQSHIYVSGKRSFHWGVISQKAGFLNEVHLMQSSLFFLDEGNRTLYAGDNGNYQRWKESRYYLTSALDFKKGIWSGTIHLPLVLQKIQDIQKLYALNNISKEILFNPNGTVKAQISTEKDVSLNYTHNTHYGDLTDTYAGAILVNYRNISVREALIPRSKVHSAALRYNSQKSIKFFFFNAGINYSRINSSIMMASTIKDSIEQSLFLNNNNVQKRWSCNVGLSKLIFSWKLNVGLNAEYSFSNQNMLLNNNLVPLSSMAYSTSVFFLKRFSNIISVDYKAKYNCLKTSAFHQKDEVALSQNVNNVSQVIQCSIHPGKKLLIDFTLRHSIQKNYFITQDYFFSDATIRYTFLKGKTDLSIAGYNLFNVKSYLYINANNYQVVDNYYNLRGRMVIVKANFYL